DPANPKANDFTEDAVRYTLAQFLSNRFTFEWAAVALAGKTTGGIFPSAYHAKVAVRDGSAFWLSSGNWQSSNQPDIDPLGRDRNLPNVQQVFNREWHIIVEHSGLAALYEYFVLWDMWQASAFQVAPLMFSLPDLFVPGADVVAAALSFASRPRYFAP